MKRVYSDLEYATNLMLTHNRERFSTLFPFTTENLNGYMSEFDFNGKSVLTVGSSADQIINAYLMGAREVVCFDINPLVKYYYDLKVAGICCLEFSEFVNFFCYYSKSKFFRNKDAFSLDIFSRLLPFLDSESRYFWQSLLESFRSKSIRKYLFSRDEYSLECLRNINSYFSIDNFNYLKGILGKVKLEFINEDVRYVSRLLNRKFDYIMLSNISSFIQKLYSVDGIYGFRRNVLSLEEFLESNGVLFLAYLYDMSYERKVPFYWDAIYDISNVRNVFCDRDISMISFPGVDSFIRGDKSVKDSVLFYKK